MFLKITVSILIIAQSNDTAYITITCIFLVITWLVTTRHITWSRWWLVDLVMLVLKIWPQYKIGRILHLKLKENPAHEEEQKLYNKDICGKQKLLENLPQVVVKLA